MPITDAFSPFYDCCGFDESTTTEDNLKDIWQAEYTYLDSIMTSLYQKEIFGKPDTEDYYNKINDFNYLTILMIIINQERIEDAEYDVDKGDEYYVEAYNIKCIKDYFKCSGYNITDILSIFDLDNYGI